MNKRDSIIDSFKEADERELAAKIIDSVEQVQRLYEVRYTDFLDPASIFKAEKVLKNYFDIKYSITCGVEGCERNIIAIYPDYMSADDIDIPVSALKLTGKSKFDNVTHRDVLGAVMGLGIKREKIGDIIINGDRYYIFARNDISYYIVLNLKMIKHTPVEIDYVDFSDVPKRQDNYKTITSNVASLRLDALLGCGFGESRSSISQEILKGNVKVNWEEVRELSHIIKENDVISLKGRGRIIIDSIGNTTRKGRINVVIKKVL